MSNSNKEGKAAKVAEFKALNDRVKAGTATPEELKKAAELAHGFKSKSKGKRPNRHELEKPSMGSNDVEWYKKYPELFRDASNVIFNEIAGTEFQVHFPVSTIANTLQWPTCGARFEIIPTIGKSQDPNDAFNYQMRSLWLQLHRAYRGVGTYEYADLGITIFAIMCAFADVARAERIYGVLNKFDPLNRSFPTCLLAAMGVDYSTISSANIADFRYQLNRIIAKAKLLCLPKGMSAFEQYITIFGNIYKDSDNPRAQWYFYDSPVMVTYDPSSFTTGGAAQYAVRKAGTNGQSLQDILDDLDTVFDALLQDTDVARMCSDILKAFGENGVQTLLPVPETFVIELINDEIRKLQMHNTVFCGYVAGGNFSSNFFGELGTAMDWHDYLCVYQENGVVKQSLFTVSGVTEGTTWKYANVSGRMIPCVTTSALYPDTVLSDDIFIDSWHDVVTPDEVVEMTRQTITRSHISTSVAGFTEAYELDSYSSYVVMGMFLYNNDIVGIPYLINGWRNNIERASTAGVIEQAAVISQIDWHPYIGYLELSGGTPVGYAIFYDLDNYSLISKESLRRLHETCTLSLFKLDLIPHGE